MAEVEQATEALVGEVLDAVDQNTSPEGLIALGLGISFVIGIGTGYLVAKKLWQSKFDDLLSDEIVKIREHYAAKALVNETPKPPLDEVVKDLGYVPPPAKEVLVQPVQPVVVVVDKDEIEEEPNENRNAFDAAEPHGLWDYALEIKSRTADVPYVIHLDEYRENANSYTQVNLSYFEGDDVLCDQDDEIIEQEDVGVQNLAKFGHGSGDVNVVFVRNDRLNVDFEIMRSPGTYAQEVHGFEPDIRHSNERRQRFDDE